MASLQKAAGRDKKRRQRRHGMRTSGRSLVHIGNAVAKRAEKARRNQARKQKQQEQGQ